MQTGTSLIITWSLKRLDKGLVRELYITGHGLRWIFTFTSLGAEVQNEHKTKQMKEGRQTEIPTKRNPILNIVEKHQLNLLMV